MSSKQREELSLNASVGALRIVSASSVSLEEYAAVFTSAFAGYKFSIAVSAAGLARRIRIEQHDLEHSLVAYDGDGPVGVAALAVRGEAGWVGGLGVVPEQRGRGRGRELMAALIAQARACRLRSLSLEVLVDNTPARRLYEGVGMRVTRHLLILERAGGAQRISEGAQKLSEGDARATSVEGGGGPEDGSLNECESAELIPHFARLHTERPAWQRDLPAMLVGRSRGFYVGERGRPSAYALAAEGPDGNTYLSDLAASGAEAAGELCAPLARLLPGTLKVVNESEHSLFVAPLLANGFVETERQHEMVLDL